MLGNITSSRPSSSVFSANMSPPSHSVYPSIRPQACPSAPSNQSHSKPITVSSLMSPAEDPVQSFTKDSPTVISVNNFKTPQPEAQRPPSPPISPWARSDNQTTDTASIDGSRDPILIPDAAPETQSQPLFRSTRAFSPVVQQAVNAHMRALRNANPTAKYPTAEEYGIVLACVECMMKSFQKNPRAWLSRERAWLVQDDKARRAARQSLHQPNHRSTVYYPLLQPKALAPRPSSSVVVKSDPTKSATAPRHSTKVQKPRASRPARAQPPKPTQERSNSSAPQSARTRQSAATREDKNYLAIPDYCPPLSSLDSSKPLRVEWKGSNSAVDLSDDPLRHLLHPSELNIASQLRLDCATYLTSKRRIFHRRLQFYHNNEKEFRKTHAQQATRIDVNKASKLHTAFEEVGWFHVEWVKHLAKPAPLDD